jgi:hypothetical protein
VHVHYWRTRTCKKAVCRARGGERENEGHVLKDTTSRGPRPRLAVSHGACAALSSAHAGGPGPETRSGPASRRPAPAATGFPRPAGAGAARGSWREPPAAGAAYPLAHVFDSPLPPRTQLFTRSCSDDDAVYCNKHSIPCTFLPLPPRHTTFNYFYVHVHTGTYTGMYVHVYMRVCVLLEDLVLQ